MAGFGNFCIITATGTSLISAILYTLVWRGREEFRRLARMFFVASSGLLLAAIGTLLYLILSHDYTIAYVFSYSSSDLPLWYKIASLWGGQEGTFLLWIVMVSVMGLVLIRSAGEFESGTMLFTNLFILSILIILLKKSPFEYLPVFRAEGQGLNPLLQNYWMTIHPPVMFVGFAAAVIPAAFAFTALVARKYATWSEEARRWTLFAWASLGIALVMGGYWAYETLGWGGFWAWDPVENSSFIPWIFLAAQIHALFIKRQRRGLMRFSLFIVLLTFWSVLYGTFLTRSGVLADFSVHSFVDLGLNNFLVGGLIAFVSVGIFLLVLRWRDIKPGKSYSTVSSRSYMVALGIVVLFIGGVLTLLGTSAPLLTRVSDNPSAVGLNYYFATMTPVAVAVLILLALFPNFRWNQGMSRPKLLMIGAAAAVVTMLLLVATGVTTEVIYLLLFGAAVWALVSNSYVLWSSWRQQSFQPAYLAHVGLTVALVGAAVSAGFERKQTIHLPMGADVQAMGYTLQFVNSYEAPKGFDCHVEVTAGNDQFTAVLPHEFPRNMDGVMKKPHVEKFLGYDFYMSPVSIEQPEAPDPGQFVLAKGESYSVDKYTITFHDFDLGNHGEEGMTEAGALITVAFDEREESIRPALRAVESDLSVLPATFDDERGTLTITGVRPDDGSVMLQLEGDFVPTSSATQASLVIELAEKPLINLFWLGTILLFTSGLLSMRERRRREDAVRRSIRLTKTDRVSEASTRERVA